MKSLSFLLLNLSLLVMTEQACSQDERTAKSEIPLSNPMYSTHNYKHPNMAAAARRWERKKGIVVRKPVAGDAQLANYKKQMPLAEPIGGITLVHRPSTDLADRNYKMQQLSEPQPLMSTNEYYIKRQPTRKPGGTAIGE